MRLHWNEGHVWRSQPIKVPEELNEDFFEYKLFLKNGDSVVRWQNGSNNVFNLKKLKLIIKELNVLGSLDSQGQSQILNIDRRTRVRVESTKQ